MTFHTGQQASKQMQCNANHEAPPAESSKRSPLSRNVGRPLTGIVLNLTLPKLHLATLIYCLYISRMACPAIIAKKKPFPEPGNIISWRFPFIMVF